MTIGRRSSHDQIDIAGYGVARDGVSKSGICASGRRKSRVLRTVLSERELPELRTGQSHVSRLWLVPQLWRDAHVRLAPPLSLSPPPLLLQMRRRSSCAAAGELDNPPCFD